jgi:hypothetical protein
VELLVPHEKLCAVVAGAEGFGATAVTAGWAVVVDAQLKQVPLDVAVQVLQDGQLLRPQIFLSMRHTAAALVVLGETLAQVALGFIMNPVLVVISVAESCAWNEAWRF